MLKNIQMYVNCGKILQYGLFNKLGKIIINIMYAIGFADIS